MSLNLQVARGKYSYTSPEGELIEVIWEADENGKSSLNALFNFMIFNDCIFFNLIGFRPQGMSEVP